MEQKRRGLLLLLFMVGLVVVAATWMRGRTPRDNGAADAARGGPSASELPALAEQYRQLDARLARLEMQIGATQSPGQPNTIQAPLPSADPAAELAQEQAQAAQRRARYQHLFESDARAADASKWEAVIARAFSDPNVVDAPGQPSTRSAQCRARLCLIAAKFPPGTDGSDWATRISMALVEGFTNSRVVLATLPSGETSLTIYAFKKGGDKALLDQGL